MKIAWRVYEDCVGKWLNLSWPLDEFQLLTLFLSLPSLLVQ